MRVLLAGDIGGTHTRFLLAREDGTGADSLFEREFPSANFASATDALRTFLTEVPRAGLDRISAACLAMAGPVNGDRAHLTNLGWEVSAPALAMACGLPRVTLVNDFTAIATALPKLPASELIPLQAGVADAEAPRVVVGAGTGLGVALIVTQNGRSTVLPSEAGHMDFAPADELQERLRRYLKQSFGRVSCERVVSGPGLLRILSFLESQSAEPRSPALTEAMQRDDPAGALAELGVKRGDPLAVKTLDLFVTAYGAFAGNVALALLARGGVYLAGGIAPRLASKLADGSFSRAFTSKGRFTELLAQFPVHIVRDPRAGLLGALEIARGL
jgi:glucokinase